MNQGIFSANYEQEQLQDLCLNQQQGMHSFLIYDLCSVWVIQNFFFCLCFESSRQLELENQYQQPFGNLYHAEMKEMHQLLECNENSHGTSLKSDCYHNSQMMGVLWNPWAYMHQPQSWETPQNYDHEERRVSLGTLMFHQY